MKLHLGCGKDYRQGWTNVDAVSGIGCDVVHDLNVTPWPFADGSATEVYMNQVLEHLVDVPKTLQEIYRVLQTGGFAVIQVPYLKTEAAFYDPTHLHFFTERSLEFFRQGHPAAHYCGAGFTSITAELQTSKELARHRVRNLLLPRPVRLALRFFVWNMFDGLKFTLVK